jgi:hypothetical protein
MKARFFLVGGAMCGHLTSVRHGGEEDEMT